jgi:hypothetical protein
MDRRADTGRTLIDRHAFAVVACDLEINRVHSRLLAFDCPRELAFLLASARFGSDSPDAAGDGADEVDV